MKAELIKEEVVPVFKPIAITVTIESQEEYDAIQLAGKTLTRGEIQAHKGFAPYSLSERTVWVTLLERIAQETKNVN